MIEIDLDPTKSKSNAIIDSFRGGMRIDSMNTQAGATITHLHSLSKKPPEFTMVRRFDHEKRCSKWYGRLNINMGGNEVECDFEGWSNEVKLSFPRLENPETSYRLQFSKNGVRLSKVWYKSPNDKVERRVRNLTIFQDEFSTWEIRHIQSYFSDSEGSGDDTRF